MANIKTHLNNIKGALYGKDVRGSIHDGIDAINKEVENTTGRQVDLENTFDQLVINAGNSNAEIVDARVKNDGTSYSKLGDRLDAVDSQLAHKVNIDSLINIDVENIKDIYLYDLKLNNVNPAQCIVCDDENENFYVTQPIYNDNSATESLGIYRLSLNGCVLDSMVVEYGGHGTTFGIYKENGKTYIFSDINKVNSDGSHSGYSYMCKFEYVPNQTIDIDSSIVVKYVENVGDDYITPFTDYKNNLIGYRKVENGKKSIEIRYISDIISGKENLLYSYPYTSEMSSLSLQGICIDGETNKLYISFGDNRTPFKLFEIDYTTGEILNTIEKQIGLDENGIYEDNIGEPQGLCIFKNTRTHEKTLISLVSSGIDSKRRRKVIALSSNNGVNYLFGLKNEITQNYKLTRDNGESKRIQSGCDNLTAIKDAGFYYITTVESANLTDHPEPNVAGWWLHVYTTDANNRGYVQKLIKNSDEEYIEYIRIIANSTSLPTPWRRLNVSEVDITLPKKVITLSNIDSLASIKQPNMYYMSTSLTNNLIDHPEPGVAGWFLEVLNSTTDGKFIQRLIKNSDSYPKTYQRLVKGDVGGAWKLVMTQTKAHGTTSERPTSSYELIPGSMYFDTSLNKPIFRNKNNNGWVDASGASV